MMANILGPADEVRALLDSRKDPRLVTSASDSITHDEPLSRSDIVSLGARLALWQAGIVEANEDSAALNDFRRHASLRQRFRAARAAAREAWKWGSRL